MFNKSLSTALSIRIHQNHPLVFMNMQNSITYSVVDLKQYYLSYGHTTSNTIRVGISRWWSHCI